jgi:trk system potassium uptake protein TrkH
MFTSAISCLLGLLLKTLFNSNTLNKLQAVMVCSLGWITLSFVGALPFYFLSPAGFLNSYFETISGFTTTGFTMLTNLQTLPHSLLFWRALIQWIGGLGILTFFLAVFSATGAAHRLYSAESHKISTERLVPGLSHMLKILWSIYLGITAAIALALLISGVGWFDSISHALTTISTGGYSTYDASIGHFQAIGHPHFKLIEYIIILGMFLGGTNFLIHFQLLRGKFKPFFTSPEMKLWLSLIFLYPLLILLEKYLAAPTVEFWNNFETHFRNSLFQVTAIFTTTGYATKDIASPYFGSMAKLLFLAMMFTGSCVSSTSGGFKLLRISILWKLVKREIYKLFAPKKAIKSVILEKKAVEADEIYRVSGLFFIWVILLVVGGAVTTLLSDHNTFKSISGMFSALGNIGPCYLSVQEIIDLNPFTKLTYIFGMLAGRLEILPVLLLFSPKAWKS